jgi:hypothetical protein
MMSEPLPLPEDSTNKKKIILRLLSECRYSTKDIARIVGTSEDMYGRRRANQRQPAF